MEQKQLEVDIRHYDLKQQDGNAARMQTAKDYFGKPLLRLKVPGLAEKRPSILHNDAVYCCSPGTEFKETQWQGFVHRVERDDVLLRFNAKFHTRFINNMEYDLRFTVSRGPVLRCLQALSDLSKHGAGGGYLLNPFLPPFSMTDKLTFPRTLPPLDFFDRLNPEQKRAVQTIVSRGSLPPDTTSKSLPYVVFGPPGTGKTTVVVEAVKQLALDSSNHILVAAPSNSAADVMCERLAQGGRGLLSRKDMIRVNAFKRNKESVPPKVLEFSVYDEKNGSFPTPIPEVLQRCRVVVSTCSTAHSFIQEQRFTHVLVDEAGHATEPECLIALSCSAVRDGADVVLVGDPKQLGPVIRCSLATKNGLSVSLLERLLKTELYGYQGGPKTPEDLWDAPSQAHSVQAQEQHFQSLLREFSRTHITVEHKTNPYLDDYNGYDPRVLTKLVRNYRSHPVLLRLPSAMFYEAHLLPCADELDRNIFCRWGDLPQRNVPLIFHCIDGKEDREGNSPSFFNVAEIIEVGKYIDRVLRYRPAAVSAEDIGVISPYSKQVHKIRRILKAKGLQRVKVGSVEEFQGQERKVIIVSVVRSSSDWLDHDKKYNLGFVGNPKRFNVSITRAKALLIVIGNPAALREDECWGLLLQYAKTLGCLTGDVELADSDSDEEGGGDEGRPAGASMGDLLARFQRLNLTAHNSAAPDAPIDREEQ